MASLNLFQASGTWASITKVMVAAVAAVVKVVGVAEKPDTAQDAINYMRLTTWIQFLMTYTDWASRSQTGADGETKLETKAESMSPAAYA